MGQSVFPAPAAGKTRYQTTLTSGTSYTVPTGVTYLNVTLRGGGAGGSGCASGSGYPNPTGLKGCGGQVKSSIVTTTSGASIVYAIGAGGAGAGTGSYGSAGGSTTFTGANTASGGDGASGTTGPSADNGGNGGLAGNPGYSGGSGSIDIEYWL